MTNDLREKDGFLFLHGARIVQWILLASVVSNGLAAAAHFRSGRMMLGVLAIVAMFLLPRALFALFLIHERAGTMTTNLTPLLKALYPRTIARYQPPFTVEAFKQLTYVHGAGLPYAREGFKLSLFLVPIIALAFYPG